MVEQDVSGRDRFEHAVLLAEPYRQARREARVLEVGPVHEIRQGHQAVEVDRPVHPVQARFLQVEAPAQEGDHVRGQVSSTSRRTASP